MPVFLFSGPDTYTQREKLDFWRREFEKKHGGDMNIARMSGKESRANDIFQACCSAPFLAEKRLTIVKNFMSEGAAEEISALAEVIERIPDFCVLVISEMGEVDRRLSLYKKVSKFGTVTEFSAVTGSRLLQWIEKQLARRGGAIERDALVYLSELSAGDLYRLENEIAKLAAYADSRPITRADVALLVDTQLSTSIFRLTDSIGTKQAPASLQTLHQLIDSGEDLHHMLYMIMRQFRIITIVKDLAAQGMRKDEIAAKIKEHPFVVSNTLSQVKNFSMEQLTHAYELLVDIDTKLKSGGIKILAADKREFVLALDRLVIELCH